MKTLLTIVAAMLFGVAAHVIAADAAKEPTSKPTTSSAPASTSAPAKAPVGGAV